MLLKMIDLIISMCEISNCTSTASSTRTIIQTLISNRSKPAFCISCMLPSRNPRRPHASPIVDVQDFIEKYPLFVFDTSRQNDKIQPNAPVDIRLEVQTHSGIPPKTACYCLILHNKLVQYQPSTGLVHKY